MKHKAKDQTRSSCWFICSPVDKSTRKARLLSGRGLIDESNQGSRLKDINAAASKPSTSARACPCHCHSSLVPRLMLETLASVQVTFFSLNSELKSASFFLFFFNSDFYMLFTLSHAFLDSEGK